MGASLNYMFDSRVSILGDFNANWDKDTIKNEPMFYKSHIDFVREHGGPITQEFLANLPDGWDDCIIDSRSHMLMNGWYPAIPGYHHDDVPRPKAPEGSHFLSAGQPDYDNPAYYSEHLMGLVNAHICPTDFIIGKCRMTAVPEGELIYRQWHNELLRLLADGEVDIYKAESGKYIYFDWRTFHQAVPAVSSGWRWFIRLTRNSDTVKNPQNEIRKQVQVYLEFPMEGW